MKLLFVTTHLPPDNHFGGVVQSGHSLIKSLKKNIPDVTVCCVSADPKKVQEKNIHDPFCTKTFILHRWGFSFNFASCFKKLAKKADIIVINGIMTYPMTTAGIIAKNLGKPYIVSLRGGLLPYHMAMKPKRKKAFFKLFVKPILENAAAIHATCKEEHDRTIELGLKTPITIIPNGANLPPENINTSKQLFPKKLNHLSMQKKVLFMGRVEPIKGLDLLLRAWADLTSNDNYKNVYLIIAGPDERNYTKKLRALALKLGINDKVIFYGMADDNSKWSLYKQADVFILPSYSENFGLVVAEALACQTPVIATTSTPWEELEIHNAGKWVKPEKKTISKALKQLLDMTDNEREAIGKRGKKLVQENYSWDMIGKKTTAFYRNVLEKKNNTVYPEKK